MKLLQTVGLKKLFCIEGREVAALNGVDLEVAEGEFVVVVGRSGSGKTTLLRVLAGLEVKTSGSVEFQRGPGR